MLVIFRQSFTTPHRKVRRSESFHYMNIQSTTNETVRLPLWKSCLDDMIASGIQFGNVYPTTYFEERLRLCRESLRFGLDISEIRKSLEHLGFYLCGRGQKGEQFVILPPEANADVMAAYSRAASQALTRGVILGTNTRLDTLSTEARRRHESMLTKLATKAALVSRPWKDVRELGVQTKKNVNG